MPKYRLATEVERAKFAPELVGKGHVIVCNEKKFWVVKHVPGVSKVGERELLGYLLGYKFANIAEVKLLSQIEHEEVRILAVKGNDSIPDNTCLVRLGGSYSIQELPCKTLEQAVARELVYSVWIRRRDTHADNRVYADGLPIFFDHNIAFLADPKFAHSTSFFKTAKDYGYPLFWRVKKITGEMDTIRARTVSNEREKAYHYVNDITRFKEELSFAEEEMKKINSIDFRQAIMNCGFNSDESSLIDNFLANNLITLNSDIEMMKDIVFQE